MKQTDKELQFKDLCARLPYRIKASFYDVEKECEIWDEVKDISSDGYVCIGQYSLPIESIKPYLRPLSDMTKEELFEAQEILGKNEIKIDDGFLRIVDSDRKTFTYLEILALIDWFYKNHFDIHDLIPKGLAIKAPDGMYN